MASALLLSLLLPKPPGYPFLVQRRKLWEVLKAIREYRGFIHTLMQHPFSPTQGQVLRPHMPDLRIGLPKDFLCRTCRGALCRVED